MQTPPVMQMKSAMLTLLAMQTFQATQTAPITQTILDTQTCTRPGRLSLPCRPPCHADSSYCHATQTNVKVKYLYTLFITKKLPKVPSIDKGDFVWSTNRSIYHYNLLYLLMTAQLTVVVTRYLTCQTLHHLLHSAVVSSCSEAARTRQFSLWSEQPLPVVWRSFLRGCPTRIVTKLFRSVVWVSKKLNHSIRTQEVHRRQKIIQTAHLIRQVKESTEISMRKKIKLEKWNTFRHSTNYCKLSEEDKSETEQSAMVTLHHVISIGPIFNY